MNSENKLYQLTLIFSPLVKEEKLKEILSNLKQKITALSGSVSEEIPSSESAPIKKRLAYPIKKQPEAFFSFFKFVLLPESIKEIKKYIDSREEILRHLIISKKITKAKPTKETIDMKLIDKIEPFRKAPMPDRGPERSRGEKPVKKEKVKIEELDKKLKEILDE